MKVIKKSLTNRKKKKSKVSKIILKINRSIQYLGRKTLVILKTFITPLRTVFKLLELIGKTTLYLIQLLLRLAIFYITRVKKTVLRVFILIQFIGETTLLAGFVLSVIIRGLLQKAGIVGKPSKKSRTARFSDRLISLWIGIRSFSLQKIPPYAYATTLVIVFLWGIYYTTFLKELPSPYDLETKPLPQSSQVVDRSGKLLFLAYNGKINRVPIGITKVPNHVKWATIAIEDRDFYHHDGISVRGITRALVNNFKNESTQGGSTITQQLVKIALLRDNRRVVSRKIKEAYLAILVERVYSKDKILEMYLNNAPYGGTAYGIEAGARKYFGKDASQLNLSEAALLASLPSAPSLYSPYGTTEEVYKRKQKQVLDDMVSLEFVTKQQAQDAYNEKLTFYSIDNQIFAPHFVFWVLDQLEQNYGKEQIQEGGLVIQTTLDLPTQLKAEQIVKENVEEVEKMYWISNAAALVTEPKTGRILAMVGSRDYFDKEHDGNVNVTVSKRQPGSSIKVVNYSYALSHGFTPSSIIDDSPVSYRNAWETYIPVNYDGKYRGSVTLKQALAMSLNIPAVKVLNTYGPDKMVELGIKMGIESWKDLKNYGLSLTLGAGEVKMTELATVYGTFTNLGKRKDLYAVEKISDRSGKILADSSTNTKKGILGVSQAQAAEGDQNEVIPQNTAYQITNILSDNAARMPAFGPFAKLEIPGHKVAVKTGTTNNIRDNWTIGFTPDFLVASWVGNNDNSPMNPHLTSGITGAAPIWNEIMGSLISDKPAEQYATPSGMIKVKVCATNGLLTCARCPKEVEEFFAPGSEPKTACYFPTAQECKAKKDQMTSEGKSPDEISKSLVNCPAGSTN